MSPRIPAVMVLLVVVSLVLAGCGGPDDNSPEGVVRRFFDRLEDQDASAVRNLLCEDYRQNVNLDHEGDEDISFDFDLGFDGEGSADAEGDTADVLVSGKIERSVRTDDVRAEVRIQRDDEAAWVVRTFKVEGDWRVCGADPFILSLLDIPAAFAELE